MWRYMVCVKVTKFYASLESLGQSPRGITL